VRDEGSVHIGENELNRRHNEERSATGLIRDHLFVRIAVEPVLAGLRGGDDRMTARVRVFARVLIRRAIATERHAALLTCPEMDPVRADLDALLTFLSLGRLDLGDRAQMSADVFGCHGGTYSCNT
jgi:hypothetical protein